MISIDMNKLVIVFAIIVAIISIILFIMMGVDKSCARKHLRRIPEATLFAFAFCFGALGGTLGMFAFRHKTKHWYFRIFFPLLAIIQVGLLIFLAIKL